MIENHTRTTDCTTESRLNSDTLRPENSVGGVLGRSGGGQIIVPQCVLQNNHSFNYI